MKKRIGIDIDGTVTCPSSLIPHINKEFSTALTLEDIKEYDLTKALNIEPHIFSEWFKQAEAGIYASSPLAKGSKFIFDQWENEFELCYISARPTSLLDVTKSWFEQMNVPYHEMELIGSHYKVEMAKEKKVDLFMEDKHDNAVSIHKELGIPVLLFDTPYNQEPIPSGVVRVKDWQEAYEWVERWKKES